jgi:DNA repair protein RecO
MYAIHQTKGFILGNIESGEVDTFYYIYTEDFGLLGILATGVRMQKSKFKYTLQPYSHVEVGFVKGKATLRLTHTQLLGRTATVDQNILLARLFERLRRMVKGEERNDELYDLLESVFTFVLSSEELTPQDKYSLELMFAMRLLDALGYWASRVEDMPFLKAPVSRELCQELYEKRSAYLPRVQEAITETQL